MQQNTTNYRQQQLQEEQIKKRKEKPYLALIKKVAVFATVTRRMSKRYNLTPIWSQAFRNTNYKVHTENGVWSWDFAACSLQFAAWSVMFGVSSVQCKELCALILIVFHLIDS